MIGSAVTSALARAGAVAKGISRSAPAHSRHVRRAAPDEESFARAVHPAPWHAAAALSSTLLIGGGLGVLLAVSPPSAGVRRMLEEPSAATRGPELVTVSYALSPYALSPHWRSPTLASTPAPDVELPCETLDQGPC